MMGSAFCCGTNCRNSRNEARDNALSEPKWAHQSQTNGLFADQQGEVFNGGQPQ
jgi:hypothetical protein